MRTAFQFRCMRILNFYCKFHLKVAQTLPSGIIISTYPCIISGYQRNKTSGYLKHRISQ